MKAQRQAQERRLAADVAAGRAVADRVLSGGKVLNVHTGRISRSDVAIAGSRIAAVGDVEYTVGPHTEVVDVSGLFLLPGFIDSHIHLGGSQLTIQRLAEVLVPHGTIAVSTDFYELGTIGGLPAVLSELENARGAGVDILLSPFIAAVLGIGAFGNLERFSYDDLVTLLEHEDCVELREWNCWANWLPLEGQQQVYETALRLGRTVGGHLEGLTGAHLQSSVALGVRSEHEAVDVDEALERWELGVNVQIRGGSAARDFDDLVPAITQRGADSSYFSFCTDEQELAAIAHDGHIDRLVRRAIREGIAPVDAVRMATINAARGIGIDNDYGSISPGRFASIVAVQDLATLPISLVLSRGEVAARDGEYLLAPELAVYGAETRQAIVIDDPITIDDFLIAEPDGQMRARVIGIVPSKLATQELVEDIELEGGRLQGADGLAKIAVFDRHLGGKERAVGLIRGFGIERGAVAATVNPGMMNLMTVGVDETDMAAAATAVAKMGGGIAVAVDGEVVASVALPIHGILT
ncbi:MAG TPA: adenine deaminase C-terminal domain-containing protein, partial [Homoserinimonas sp.]|nr:adenine deaminase C-terminal domain-containing protein [Homoserinimonas sp.]